MNAGDEKRVKRDEYLHETVHRQVEEFREFLARDAVESARLKEEREVEFARLKEEHEVRFRKFEEHMDEEMEKIRLRTVAMVEKLNADRECCSSHISNIQRRLTFVEAVYGISTHTGGTPGPHPTVRGDQTGC